MNQTRLHKLYRILNDQQLDAVIITNPQNRRYYSGFTGSAGVLVVGLTKAYIVTDFRYWEQAGIEAVKFELIKQGQYVWTSVFEVINAAAWKRIGFEAEDVTYRDYLQIAKLAQDVELVALTDEVKRGRWAKDTAEIETLAEGARITDLAWQQTISKIKPGVKERDLALEFDYQLRLNGAEGSAFTTIVASGYRSALPHGAASGKEIQAGDLVIIDGGALYQGYHADMTRTVVVGRATDEQKKIYQLVLDAQMRALSLLKSGLTGKEADAFARELITDAGYGANFGHGLGHSVGLEIHESPRLSPSEPNQIPLDSVVTVEPGIYLPNWGGVRIEDLVVVGETGVRNLTGSPKTELIEL
ncbi:MAG TPA: Xaa-Pro peptidase family protein [Bacillota bacterium]|nr:Xaa-Pro peptidase family protein [Bacillota bacterium]HOL08750.1 Xaa-Pro peptidase family protein [Bacillota bacterium]HPO96347.1 Xaa-Pro peptidase family protein [Bacillota bacterium]